MQLSEPPAQATPQFLLRSTPVQLVPGIGRRFFRQRRSYRQTIRHHHVINRAHMNL